MKVLSVATFYGKYTCALTFKNFSPEGDVGNDVESIVRARFSVNDEACLTFADKEGAQMLPQLARPVHLDSQVENGKQLASTLVVCRMGRCAAAAKAERARHAGAKCLVISLDHDGQLGLRWQLMGALRIEGRHVPAQLLQVGLQRQLFHPQLALALTSKTEFTEREWDAFGIKDVRKDDFIKSGVNIFAPAAGRRLVAPACGLDSAKHIDIPVFCVARHDEVRLLSAASVRACLIPAGEEKAAQLSEEEGKQKESREENILEQIPSTRPKGSRELSSKWSRWMEKVGMDGK